MIFSTLPSLKELSATTVVYQLWIHEDILQKANDERQWYEFDNQVALNMDELCLPETLETVVENLVEPVGGHFYHFLTLWGQKLNRFDTTWWLTGDILQKYLSLHCLGMINQRKTAQNILKSGILGKLDAFRLACVNFVEDEVLKVWPSVAKYILSRIPERNIFPYEAEPEEVLFWVSYCISKDQGTELSNFKEDQDCVDCCLHSCADIGNMSCIDYIRDKLDPYGNLHSSSYNVLKRSFLSYGKYHPGPFLYHYLSLNSEDKTKLLNKYCSYILKHFLQWPLSYVFINVCNEFWDFLSVECFLSVLSFMLGIIKREKAVIFPLTFSVSHLVDKWADFWKGSPETHRREIVKQHILARIVSSIKEFQTEEYDFNSSELKKKLLELFVFDGEAALDFFRDDNIPRSLKNVARKYIPSASLDIESKRLLECFHVGFEPCCRMYPAGTEHHKQHSKEPNEEYTNDFQKYKRNLKKKAKAKSHA